MTVELRPLGVACNLACTYCYQNPIRDAGNVRALYALESMKNAVKVEGGPFALFGGEPLLMPFSDLENLFEWGFQQFGGSSIQTNGTLIEDKHIQLFLKFRVSVGISIDGPNELNELRVSSNATNTVAATQRTQQSIFKLHAAGINPTLIVTLHKANARADRLPVLHNWIRELDELGVSFVRLHLLEVENETVRSRYSLSVEENIQALDSLQNLESQLRQLRFDLFHEALQMLSGNDTHASCVWRACDPMTTQAVCGIEGNGQRSNCSRTNKLGIDFVKADYPSYERYLALYRTKVEDGGCSNCRFFLACKGQCPGTAIDGDWRNRSEHCAVWFRVFENAEVRLLANAVTPISDNSIRFRLEEVMIRAWMANQNPSLAWILSSLVPTV